MRDGGVNGGTGSGDIAAVTVCPQDVGTFTMDSVDPCIVSAGISPAVTQIASIDDGIGGERRFITVGGNQQRGWTTDLAHAGNTAVGAAAGIAVRVGNQAVAKAPVLVPRFI